MLSTSMPSALCKERMGRSQLRFHFSANLISKQTTCGGEEAVRLRVSMTKSISAPAGGAVKGDGAVLVVHVIIDAQFVINQGL